MTREKLESHEPSGSKHKKKVHFRLSVHVLSFLSPFWTLFFSLAHDGVKESKEEKEKRRKLTPGGLGDVAGSSLERVVARQELCSSEDGTGSRDALGCANATFSDGLGVGTQDQLDRGLAELCESKNGQIFVVQVFVIDHDVVSLSNRVKSRVRIQREQLSREENVCLVVLCRCAHAQPIL